MAKRAERTPDPIPVMDTPTAPVAPVAPVATEIPVPYRTATVPPEISGTPTGEVYAVLVEEVGEWGLDLVVLVSHDNVFAGDAIQAPLTVRTAGLVERGFLEVVLEGWN